MDIKALEHPTLKVPYEILNKKFRTSQKVIDREVNHVSTALTELEKVYTQENVDNSTILTQLDKVQEMLVQLQDKGGEGVLGVVDTGRVCKRRLDHLKDGCKFDEEGDNNDMQLDTTSDIQQKQWRKLRLDRFLVEHFLRSGFYDTAIKLSKQSGLEDLTDIDVYLAAKEVEESLSKGDSSKCLAWCHDNKSKLRKLKSSLEFNVRLQEYIEFVRKGEKAEAVKYARKHLSTDQPEHLDLVKHVMGLLAFPVDTQLEPYKQLLDPNGWKQLIHLFRTENYKLHQLSNQSVLSVCLQAGLASLKTHYCIEPSNQIFSHIQDKRMMRSIPEERERNIECPVCDSSLNILADGLPYSHCSQSRLVCFMSGRPLNEHNVPLMLPNGFVYGEQALLKMAEENEGQVVCPRTKQIYQFTQLEKVYVM